MNQPLPTTKPPVLTRVQHPPLLPQNKLGRCLTRKTLHRRLPCLTWMRSYSSDCIPGDLLAGFTVGLMIIPQALAYGIVAGLTPNYGLYSAFCGCLVYFLLGSTMELNLGPTAIMALMTMQYSQGGPEYAVLLCFTSGVIELVAGIINLGFLINFATRAKVGAVRWPCVDRSSRAVGQRVLRQTIFFTSVGRNAVVVVVASLIAFMLDGDDQPFTLTGFVEPGIRPFALPPFSIEANNQTITFTDIMSDVGVGVVMIPFIAILDQIAVVSAFAKGRTFDATQEIIALGVATIAGSFFRSMPITGSLSRTAVNLSSGVRTPAGGLVTGVMVLLALTFLTPCFAFIPKATLAAVIICAVLHMVDYEVLLPLWRSKRIDLIPLSVTFVACLVWGLEWGILVGIGVNLSMLLYSIATPTVKVTTVLPNKQHGGYVLVTPSHGVSYPSTSHIRAAVRKAGLRQAGGSLPIVIDCTFIDMADYTSAKGIKGMIEDFQRRGQVLVFVGLKPRVMETISALHEGVTVCPCFEQLDEILADGQTEETLGALNGGERNVGGVVLSSMIATPTSDTSEAANPLLSTTTFHEHK
ncbi:sodium-independent sulfate anion transporter-like [Penaeus monodon]|uniref:sodium-independent sulfate anion transporter-like n=1 Tax=Penaeus monodon TaxID=6687 RepID=UPI0018A7CB3D|nr:sodium-independent sulfate anion transporter-like [Penaeus monodon]